MAVMTYFRVTSDLRELQRSSTLSLFTDCSSDVDALLNCISNIIYIMVTAVQSLRQLCVLSLVRMFFWVAVFKVTDRT